ncbi:MAG: sigma 54-interacting transcriptional regulator [Nitriliruptoraceae bacterium]|nr:sigma 54-interacting transcriptional regulator [Nitriliruptoraceae bacterium]
MTARLTPDTTTLLTLLRAAGGADVPVLLWGSPGTGKSALIRTLGRLDACHTATVIGSLREPADLAGLPVVQPDGSVALAPPRWATDLRDAGGGYLFLDELSTAPPSVQAAMLRVAMEKVVGDLVLPSATRIIAAANPVDLAAGGWELEPPTANRFLHLTHRPDLDTFVDGLTGGFDAATSGRDPEPLAPPGPDATARAVAQVVGFLRARPARFDDCPTQPGAGGGAWPSPRTWHALQRLLAWLPAHLEQARRFATVGLVGDAAGLEFLAWVRHQDLPDPAAVLDGTAPLRPDLRDDQLHAILSGVTTVALARGTADAWVAAWEVVGQVPTDLGAVAARSLMRARPADAPLPDAVLTLEPVLGRAGLLPT